MQQIGQDAILQARRFLKEQGRELDRRRFAYTFAHGSQQERQQERQQEVLDALRLYQNDDGGFGHALEPDIRTRASSVIATTHAFEIMREVDAPPDDPLVQKGLRYLLAQYDPARHVWPMTSPAVEDAPHAPWWTYETQGFGGFVVNPTVSVVGYLLDYQEHVPEGFLARVLETVEERILALAAPVNLNAMLCIFDLVESENLPGDVREVVAAKLREVLPMSVESDVGKWGTYSLQPLEAAPSPDSIGAGLLPPEWIEANLDYWIETQGEDGAWPLPWSWADIDEEAWRSAEREWKGYRVVNQLRTLRAYGRIA